MPARPWGSTGIGWALAIIVAIVWALVLLHAITASDTITAVSFLLLALALLI